MSVYFVAQIKIKNELEYNLYLARCGVIFSKYNGKYLAVDSAPQIIEGSWEYSRSVIIEFPKEIDFNMWYNSNEYQSILRHRLSGARCDSILVQGK
jgi:uncharacterized protein (DUF1330 family)